MFGNGDYLFGVKNVGDGWLLNVLFADVSCFRLCVRLRLGLVGGRSDSLSYLVLRRTGNYSVYDGVRVGDY